MTMCQGKISEYIITHKEVHSDKFFEWEFTSKSKMRDIAEEAEMNS